MADNLLFDVVQLAHPSLPSKRGKLLAYEGFGALVEALSVPKYTLKTPTSL